MRSLATFYALTLSLLFTLSVQAQAHDSTGAESVVRQAADRVIAVLQVKGDEIKANPDMLYALVDEHILPHFDFERMAYYVLGRYWKDATPEQKAAFLKEFKHLLVSTYATALSEFTNEEEIIYMPVQTSSNPDVVLLPTEIRQTGSTPISVAYRMYRTEGVWRIFDVAIGGVSLVTNYRANFAGQIRKQGLDGLIDSLKEHNQPKASQAAKVDTAANSQ